MACFYLTNQPLPERRRDLVGGIAAETIKAKRDQMLNNAKAMPEKPLRVARVSMIKLREVAPDNTLCVMLTGRIGNTFIGFSHKPIGMLARQLGIVSTMIDDQINHQ